MTAIPSLDASIRTCRIDTGYAEKLFSDRYLNPHVNICPTWQGTDLTGRPACGSSFNNKTAGCNSPRERIEVENANRPQYIQYVNLDAAGIIGDLSMPDGAPSLTQWQSMRAADELDQIAGIAGSFNQQQAANIHPSCSANKYRNAMAHQRQLDRAATKIYHDERKRKY